MLGAPTITDISDGSVDADAMSISLPFVRDAALADHSWNFATKRIAPSLDPTAPLYDFTYRFNIPSDYIRLLGIQDDPPYKIEGDYILSDVNPLRIKYTYRQTNVLRWSPLFKIYVAIMLASANAELLTQSTALEERLEKKAIGVLAKARFADATEDDPDDVEANLWLDSRTTGSWRTSGDL